MYGEFGGGYRSLFAVALHYLAFLLVIGQPGRTLEDVSSWACQRGEQHVSVIGGGAYFHGRRNKC
jgi:elongation factor P hydroxylase